jgi:hypothetical protein
MLQRHLNHSGWTLAAIDDIIARGRLDDWKELRDAAAARPRFKTASFVLPNLTCPILTRSDTTSGTYMFEGNLPEWEQLVSLLW